MFMIIGGCQCEVICMFHESPPGAQVDRVLKPRCCAFTIAKIHTAICGKVSIRWYVDRVQRWDMGEVAEGVESASYKSAKKENVNEDEWGDLPGKGIHGVE